MILKALSKNHYHPNSEISPIFAQVLSIKSLTTY
ncbi:uncharacterized protein METZ01_LOCUS320518 [marine metagenome]|uniref:Uncharacterized protein n=1 Tax=marine metagenome TaxID=408172 RepID=A0A382P2N2_9ZZZZ